MSKKNKFLIFPFVLSIILLPALSFAVGLVPACGTAANPCAFKDILTLISSVTRFILVDLAVPIAAVMFFYAGFLMITSGGESASNRGKAKHIFTNTVIGLVIVAGAWIIIHTILTILGFDGSWIGL